MEFYAGASACTRNVRMKGYTGARFDLKFAKYMDMSCDACTNPFDLASPSGFPCPVRMYSILD